METLILQTLPIAPLPLPAWSRKLGLLFQRTVGWIFLPIFTGLIVVLMKYVRGYEVEDMRELRKQYRALTKEKAPLLICSNHLTFIDSAILIWAFNSNSNYFFNFRRFSWNLPAGDFFKKKFIFRVVAFLGKCLFIHRDGTKEHKDEIIGTCRYLLEKGEIVTIFPEGRRSRTGVFDTSKATYGVGKILSGLPGCRVLCVYVRANTQRHYSSYPAKHSRFKILTQVIVPQSEGVGREKYADLVSQVTGTIRNLESRYFESVPPVDLRRPVALVTGASEGIGRALALQFAKNGYDLVAVARNEERLVSLGMEAKEKHGSHTLFLKADLSQESSLSTIQDFLESSGTEVDVLINNAGFGVHGPFEKTDVAQETKLVQTQITSTIQLTKLVLPKMVAKGSGKILNVASVYSFVGVPFQSVYSASKAFLYSFSESLAKEVGASGIQVSVVCPGTTQSLFRERAGIHNKKNAGMTCEKVAEISYKELQRGTRLIVPGRINRLFVTVMPRLPQSTRSQLMSFINARRGVNVAHV